MRGPTLSQPPRPTQPNVIPMNQGRIPSPHVIAQSTQNVSQKIAQQQGSPTKPILSQSGPITQTYGQQSQYDVFSHNKSPAFEVAVPEGTKLSAPAGKWQVVDANNQASPNGYVGNFEGHGWGNYVRLKNLETGEVVGYNHMKDVGVKVGDTVDGFSDVGASGRSGNATGPHVAFTYQDAQGRSGDFAQSPYKNFLPPEVLQGIGSAVQNVENAGSQAIGAVKSVVGQVGQDVRQFFGQQSPPQSSKPLAPQTQQFIFQSPPPPVDVPQVDTSVFTPPPTPQYTPYQSTPQPASQSGSYQAPYSPNQNLGQGGGMPTRRY